MAHMMLQVHIYLILSSAFNLKAGKPALCHWKNTKDILLSTTIQIQKGKHCVSLPPINNKSHRSK